MGRYGKTIEEDSFEYQFYRALGFPPTCSDGRMSLVIRITLGDMDLLDGFYMSLPADADSLSIEDAIRRYILCESEEDRIKLKHKLSVDTNPDLLDIYDDLLFLYEQAETGEVTFSYHINNGDSDIQPTDPVSLHQSVCATDVRPSDSGAPASSLSHYKLLDLVLEVHDNSDPFSGMTVEQKDAVLKDFRCIFILYLMDRFGYQPGLQDARHKTAGKMPALPEASSLESRVLDPSPPKYLSNLLEYMTSGDVQLATCIEGEYFITPRGYELLNNIIDEAEFYIDNYDIFGDVYVKGASEVRFDTGYGGNLIVPVFISEGIDPYRALFTAALYLGNLDHLASEPAILSSEEPFRELFSLIAYCPEREIGPELLDRIILEGRSKVERQKLREARLGHIQSIERRISVIGDQ
jgi:hypothetical protein